MRPAGKKAAADFLLVGLGGVLGSLLRYALEVFLPGAFGGILLINLTGSLAIGVLGTLLLEYGAISSRGRLFWAVGVLGGYTTFSSFILGLEEYLRLGRYPSAFLYLLASYGGGLLAVFIGAALPRLWLIRESAPDPASVLETGKSDADGHSELSHSEKG